MWSEFVCFESIHLGKNTTCRWDSEIRALPGNVCISGNSNQPAIAGETHGKGRSPASHRMSSWAPTTLAILSMLIGVSLGKWCPLLGMAVAVENMMGNNSWALQIQCRSCSGRSTSSWLWTCRGLCRAGAVLSQSFQLPLAQVSYLLWTVVSWLHHWAPITFKYSKSYWERFLNDPTHYCRSPYLLGWDIFKRTFLKIKDLFTYQYTCVCSLVHLPRTAMWGSVG